MVFAGIVACQIGSASAVRTDHASLWSVGLFTNKALLGAIAVALIFAAGLVYLPFLHGVFGTEALTPAQLATVAPFPFIVWGSDEIRRLLLRRRRSRRHARICAEGEPADAGAPALGSACAAYSRSPRRLRLTSRPAWSPSCWSRSAHWRWRLFRLAEQTDTWLERPVALRPGHPR